LFRLNCVKKALDNVDVEGLLSAGSPKDEYDMEASLIESGIARLSDSGRHTLSRDEVVQVISEVWNEQFGPYSEEELARRRSAFEQVADEILR